MTSRDDPGQSAQGVAGGGTPPLQRMAPSSCRRPLVGSIDPMAPLGPATELIRGAVDLLVLSVLRLEPLTIAEIEAAIERLSDDQLTPQLHVIAKSVERLLLRHQIDRRRCNGTAREYRYRLNKTGERAVIELQKAWLRLSHASTAVVYATAIGRTNQERPPTLSRSE